MTQRNKSPDITVSVHSSYSKAVSFSGRYLWISDAKAYPPPLQ